MKKEKVNFLKLKSQGKDFSDIGSLTNIIESHENIELRIKALSQLEKINLYNNELFTFLENVAISDENTIIRAKASEIIIANYLKLGKNAIKWIIENENSVFVLKSILDATRNKNIHCYKKLRKLLINRYMSIYNLVESESEFFMDLEFLITTSTDNYRIGMIYGGNTFEDKYGFIVSIPDIRFYSINGRVRKLDLHDLELQEIPDSIGNLTKLKYLGLYNNDLASLPTSLENLQQLRFLNIFNNKFTSIPIITKLKSLRDLYIDGNQFEKVPDYFLEFIRKNVIRRYIRLGINKCEAEIIGILDIFYKSPEKADNPDFPFNYELFGYESKFGGAWFYNYNEKGHVTELVLCDVHITFLFEYICRLKHLESLYLLGCNIDKVPKAIKNLAVLKKLYLDNNSLKKLPRSLGGLKNLKMLGLPGNQLKKIPNIFASLNNLEYLNLSHNLIKKFNKRLCAINSLKTLYLNNNLLEYIPDCIKNKKNLEKLRV